MNSPLLRLGLPILAAALLTFAVMTSLAHPERPDGKPPIPPARSPFQETVAGTGVVEPNSELVSIGPHIGGIIEAVHVRVDQRVRRGEPLFTIDRRDAQSRLAVEEARLATLRVSAEDARRQYDLYRTVSDARAISRDELDRRRFAADAADTTVAESIARIEVLKTELARLTVRAPIDGTVLRVNARIGEYATAGKTRDALIALGNVEPLHIRVELDETDLSRFSADASAYARTRGYGNATSELRFVRAEPVLAPKRSLTGDGNERVDTRVLEVIYAIDDRAFRVRVGQQMDVFVQARPPAASESLPRRGS